MGRCGPGPSVMATPARPPFPDPSRFPAPPVWVTEAPHCRRRWEDPPCKSQACQYLDLQKQKRWKGGQRADTVTERGLQRSRCVRGSERDIYKGGEQLDTAAWRVGKAGKTQFPISLLMS